MAKSKRIFQPAELEAMIDRLNGLKKRRQERADELDAKADEYFRTYGVEIESLPPEKQERRNVCARQLGKAQTWREHAARLRNFKSTDKRLRHFSQKLAELRTMTFSGMMPDDSVKV